MPRRRTRRRRLAAIVLLAGCCVAGALATLVVVNSHGTSVSSCQATGSGLTFSLTPEQAQNAAIIAAVAFKMNMPDHAVTVALAASLQETKLRNLDYGDLDSLGLFQQRPSQGWGTPAQILDPTYAAGSFYDHLAQVPGWQSMAVTNAAQAVQHSAAPSAYAGWEGEARVLAIALTGEAPAALSCRISRFGGAAPPSRALGQALAGEMGTDLIGTPLTTVAGWRVASWVIAHAYQYHVRTVRFADLVWRASTGRWTATTSPATTVVVG